MQIDKNQHIPLYRQVENVLEEKITSGQWSVGEQVPTEQELADHFNISTITVKRAIIELVNKGYLYRQRGKGTFVSGFKKEQNINSFISLTTETNEEHPHQLLEFVVEKAEQGIAEKMNLNHGSKVIKIARLKIENGEPLALEYTFLPYERCSSLGSDEIDNELIYNILKNKFNILLAKAKLFIKPYIVNNEQAELLHISPNTAVFEWERYTYTKQEEIIEYSKFYIRQDKQTYYTEVEF
ncbi:GntR family transcriptional regulator [Cytobacillus purgationiresistens]|uniref:GntR family transcriptional regulator n=1 Tax=Cytobacillus purgationiresistens TaxID=863449 RepID=A0ABU0AEY8_9BACI|nr:GntR family transcriptional regulator [Cytobacillus purgationiresistens]MDQ0269819.1 GntR family transcriptional regulator [Cytobacillus purgationiresistens]